MLDALDADAVRRWIAACVDGLTASRAEIDASNVFPVADGDTGTNLLLTMRAALDAVTGGLPGATGDGAALGAAAAAVARGALRGARGNSGVIISQALRGIAETMQDLSEAGAAALCAALRRADELATAAVADPVPGTMLSVLHAAAEAARAVDGEELSVVVQAAARAAAGALAETPRQLAVLAAAGVVDSGGRGLVVLLDALARVVADAVDPAPEGGAAGPVAGSPGSIDGRRADAELLTGQGNPSSSAGFGGRADGIPPAASATVHGVGADGASGAGPGGGNVVATPGESAASCATDSAVDGSGGYPYEVMYLLDGSDSARVDALRVRLGGLGDCVSVVGDGIGGESTLWTVHVHCADVGAAIEVGIEAGRPHRIAVTRFADQIAEETARFVRDRAVLAVVRGRGTADLVRGEGATATLGPVQASALLAAITGTRSRHVVLLPNDPALTVEAERAAEQAVAGGQDVVVVPTASPVQGLAALAVHDAARRAGDDVVAMAEAAAATRRGELLVGRHEALTWVGRCQPGDLLGMLDGEVVLIEPSAGGTAGTASVEAAAGKLVDRMLGASGELVTALLGADAPEGLAAALEEHMRSEHPEVEFAAYDGAEPDTVLLLGVE